jgi:acetolactate synthase small subunit
VETLNVPGVLYEVSEEFAKRDINIKYMRSSGRQSVFRRKTDEGRTEIRIVAEFLDEATLRQTLDALKQLSSVITVKG